MDNTNNINVYSKYYIIMSITINNIEEAYSIYFFSFFK